MRVQRQVGWQQSSRVGCSWGPGRLSCMCLLDWESQGSRDARGLWEILNTSFARTESGTSHVLGELA